MDFIQLLKPLFEGTYVSLKIFFLTLLFALPLGMIVAFGRMSKKKYISAPVRVYQLIMRGTPLLLQLMIVFYAPYYLVGRTYDRFASAIFAFAINYAAYFAEIFRAGIESIPQGQYEAAKVLGYSKSKTFFRIIMPQVIKRILPPMGNETMTLVKDTALAQTIAVMELFRQATNVSSRAYSTVPLLAAGVIYFILNFIVEKLYIKAEKKLDYYK